ncbi:MULTISPECIES: hypothetical protein [Myxococcaceae]|uniref:hypothetical protein n=1 Tax=Myxococcaceae TaxID=31 RepID=UPI00188FA8CE|nr:MULTISPECIES: hypothetical protein [Myxococcaceae]MBF5045180.1 hypothetical protein [Simulacricoccus sp. 17bor-14]
MPLRAPLALGLLFLGGCVTSPPVSSSMHLDTSVRAQCEQHCSQLGLRMTAVVIYANRLGCVCEPQAPAGAPAPATSQSTRAGAAVATAAEAVSDEEEDAAAASAAQTGTPGHH